MNKMPLPLRYVLASSSGANTFACIASRQSLSGRVGGAAQGGANEACLRMFEEINKVEHIPEFIKRAKDKNDSFCFIGFRPSCI